MRGSRSAYFKYKFAPPLTSVQKICGDCTNMEICRGVNPVMKSFRFIISRHPA
jgi:hypothetical protein